MSPIQRSELDVQNIFRVTDTAELSGLEQAGIVVVDGLVNPGVYFHTNHNLSADLDSDNILSFGSGYWVKVADYGLDKEPHLTHRITKVEDDNLVIHAELADKLNKTFAQNPMTKEELLTGTDVAPKMVTAQVLKSIIKPTNDWLYDPDDPYKDDPFTVPAITNVVFSPDSYNKNTFGMLSWDMVRHSTVVSFFVELVDTVNSRLVWSTEVNEATFSLMLPKHPDGQYEARVHARTRVAKGAIGKTTVIVQAPINGENIGLSIVGGSWSKPDLEVEWLASTIPNFTRYRVEVLNASQTVLLTRHTNDTNFVFTEALNASVGFIRSCTIRVTELFASKFGEGIQVHSITAINAVPLMPTNLRYTAIANRIRVDWNLPADDTVKTVIQYRVGGSAWQEREIIGRNNTHGVIRALTNSTEYHIRVVHYDILGQGEYSNEEPIVTLAPIEPTQVNIEPAFNSVTLNLQVPTGYIGLAVWVNEINPTTVTPYYSGNNTAIAINGLASSTAYEIKYAAIDEHGEYGRIITANTNTLVGPSDLIADLAPWATRTDPLDRSWILTQFAADAIPSTRIENITAAKLTAGIIKATLAIQSEGLLSYENPSYSHKVDLGLHTHAGTVYTLSSYDKNTGDVKSGFTADGILKAKGAEIEGQVTITGGSGYAQLSDKPSSLGDISTAEGAKLGGIADGADVTNYDAIANLELVANSKMELVGLSAKKISDHGYWNGQVYSKQSFIGGAAVTATKVGGTCYFMMGLNSDPETDANYGSIDYAIYARAGDYQAYESGSSKGTILNATPADGDVLSVEYDGINVRYIINGAVLRTVAAPANLKLYFDSSFLHVNGSIKNVQFVPLTNIRDAAKKEIENSISLSSGGLAMTGNDVAVSAGKGSYADAAAGVWLGKEAGTAKLNLGNASNHIKFDGSNLDIKGKVTIASGSSGFSQFSDKPTNLNDINTTEATSLTNLSSGHGLSNYESIILHGDEDKYYPVVIYGGDQSKLRSVKIWRSYFEQAPTSWNNSSTHKAGLTLDWKGTFGGWGGAEYVSQIVKYAKSYAPCFADCFVIGSGRAFVFMLRGGGVGGAKYHIASDQTLSGIAREDPNTGSGIYYSQGLVYNHSNNAYDLPAPAPIATINNDRINGLKVSDQAFALSTTQTVIDGGLITTGAINLANNVGAGQYGKIHSGKTSVLDTAAGFWLASASDGAELNLGNDTEFLTFKNNEGFALAMSGMYLSSVSCGYGGLFEFHADSGANDTNYCRIDGSGNGNINSFMPIVNIDTQLSGQCGLGINTESGPALCLGGRGRGLDSKTDYLAVLGHSSLTTAASFEGGGSYVTSAPTLEIKSPNGAAHTRNTPLPTYSRIPYGVAGDEAWMTHPNGNVYKIYCFKSTADGKGQWIQTAHAGGARNGGDIYQ